MKALYRHYPLQVIVTAGILAFVPPGLAAFAALAGGPGEGLRVTSFGALAALGGPITALALVTRPRWAMPALQATCLALLILSLLRWKLSGADIYGAAAAGSILVALLAPLALGRDGMSPFFERAPRLWRKGQHVFTDRKIVVIDHVSKRRHPAVLRDVSLTGMGLCTHSVPTKELFAHLKREPFLKIDPGDGHELETRLVWARESGTLINFGVAVDALESMTSLVTACTESADGRGSGPNRWKALARRLSGPACWGWTGLLTLTILAQVF